MENITLNDPLDESPFTPRRSNQKFRIPKNKSTFNNRKTREFQQLVKEVDYKLHKNLKIILSLMKDDQKEAEFEVKSLLKLGFSFGYYIGTFEFEKVKFCGVYKFGFKIIENTTKVKIVRYDQSIRNETDPDWL